MKIGNTVVQPVPTENMNKVLVGKSTAHSGMLHGIVSNGGTINIGEYQLQVVSNSSQFVTLQVFRYGLNAVAEKQAWVRTKTKTEKITKFVPKIHKVQEELKIDEKVEQEDLF